VPSSDLTIFRSQFCGNRLSHFCGITGRPLVRATKDCSPALAIRSYRSVTDYLCAHRRPGISNVQKAPEPIPQCCELADYESADYKKREKQTIREKQFGEEAIAKDKFGFRCDCSRHAAGMPTWRKSMRLALATTIIGLGLSGMATG